MVRHTGRKRRRSRYRFKENRSPSAWKREEREPEVTRKACADHRAGPSIADESLRGSDASDLELDGPTICNEAQVSRGEGIADAECRIADVFCDTASDDMACVTSVADECEPDVDVSAPFCLSNSQELRIANWRVVWGLIATNGPTKMSKVQYQSVRNLIEACRSSGIQFWKANQANSDSEDAFGMENDHVKGTAKGLPHFSTLQRAYRPLLLQHLAVRSLQSLVPMDASKSGARPARFSGDGDPLAVVQLVPPSEYACIDMATGPVWEEMKSTSLLYSAVQDGRPALSTSACVDLWPVVAAREWFYGPRKMLSVDKDLTSENAEVDFRGNAAATLPGSTFAEFGDILDVKILQQRIPFQERLERCFAVPGAASSNACILRGTVSHVWTVHHARRREDPFFEENCHPDTPERDMSIAEHLNFVLYTSPNDSVNIEIPDIPESLDDDLQDSQIDEGRLRRKTKSPEVLEAIRKRKAAIREKRKKMDEAWKNWSKPLLKPGDLVVHMRPCNEGELDIPIANDRGSTTLLTSTDKQSRLCLVHRFWVENEERNRHILWIDGGDCASPDAFSRPLQASCERKHYLDVLQVLLVRLHAGPRGRDRFSATSSVGVLENGENYFVYRFALYWDAFEIQSGKSASGEGFYLLPLNLPVPARSSPHAIRAISLTPPGVKADVVFQLIIQDIITGMTEGFMGIDADGNERRVFLDLVGLLGDTPALNGELDVLGHTASAFCHLCRLRRGAQSLFGSRYSAEHIHGMISHSARGTYQHIAVHDSNAQKESCRLLGITPRTSGNAMVLRELQTSMFSARTKVPKTKSGSPVVPHHFDPYRASLVAPDHLLTGHAKDCINLVLQLLPSVQYRQTCELYMLDYLKSANLATQSRLINMDARCLYSMSMSELYAVSIVAHTAFVVGCSAEDKRTTRKTSVSDKCLEAIALVGSCSSLIAELWRLPELERDGVRAIRDFNMHRGLCTIAKLQEKTVLHLRLISEICSMEDKEYLLLDDDDCAPQRKAELVKRYKASLMAQRTLDKPNVHRVLELVFTTLPLVGHVGRIGELVLEKSHQRLKRTIRQSNQKEIQIQCMQGVAMNDWQGRLSLLITGALRGEEVALRGCYSLLAGRDRLRAINGLPTIALSQKIRAALGPGKFLEKELKSQGQNVLAPRAPLNSESVSWSLSGNLSIFHHNSLPDSPPRRILVQQFRACISTIAQTRTVTVSDSISAAYRNGIPLSSLTRGDVIEVLTLDPTFPEKHIPRLVQVSCVDSFDFTSNAGHSLWCVVAFLAVESDAGVTSAYAAVRPCACSVADAADFDSVPTSSTWTVSLESPVSFARMDVSIRKAGVLHACTSAACREVRRTRAIAHEHNSSPLDGGSFFLLRRANGYPPRKG